MFAADAVGLLQALDIPEAHVLGHSMGGRVAQWVALDHPERVCSLVLAAGSPGEIDPRNPVLRGIPLNDAVELAEKGYEGFIQSLFAGPFFFTPEFSRDHPEVVQELTETFWANRPPLRLYLRHTIARQQHQTAEHLHEITTPTRVIVGSADTITGNLRVGRYLAEHIPGAEFKTVNGSAHMLFWERPAETCSAIVKFLRRHQGQQVIELVKTTGGPNETESALRGGHLYTFLEMRECQKHPLSTTPVANPRGWFSFNCKGMPPSATSVGSSPSWAGQWRPLC